MNGKNIPCLSIRRLNIVKMVISPKLKLRFSAVPVSILPGVLVEIESWFKIHVELQWIQDSQNCWKKSRKVGLMLPSFKTYYKSAFIETAWCWHKDRCIYQWYKIESSEINPCVFGQQECQDHLIMKEKSFR